MKLTAHAKIQVVVEVTAPGTYGADWTLDTLHEQAEREALASLAEVLRKSDERARIRIVGEPKVVDVIMRRTEG